MDAGEKALAEMGTGDPRYWDTRHQLTELRSEWAMDGPVRGRAEGGRPYAGEPAQGKAKVQVNRNPNGVRVSVDDGESVAAIMARLRRDDPEAVDRIARGESTAHFEAVKRGWRKPTVTLGNPETVAARLREHYSQRSLPVPGL